MTTLRGQQVSVDSDSLQLDAGNAIELRKLRDESADPGSPANGEVWFNTTTGRAKIHRANGNENLIGLIFEGLRTNANSDVMGASSVLERTFQQSAANISFSIPANGLKAGHTYRITMFGRFTTGAATTVTIRVRLGGTTGAAIFDSDSFNGYSAAGATANVPFGCIAIFRVVSVGASGVGRSGCYGFVGSQLTPTLGVQTGFDTTGALTVTGTIQFGTSNASNGGFINQFTIEPMGDNP